MLVLRYIKAQGVCVWCRKALVLVRYEPEPPDRTIPPNEEEMVFRKHSVGDMSKFFHISNKVGYRESLALIKTNVVCSIVFKYVLLPFYKCS